MASSNDFSGAPSSSEPPLRELALQHGSMVATITHLVDNNSDIDDDMAWSRLRRPEPRPLLMLTNSLTV